MCDDIPYLWIILKHLLRLEFSIDVQFFFFKWIE